MKNKFISVFSNSFLLWFDNFLLKNGEAFSTESVNFRLDSTYKDFPALNSFISKHNQITADESIKNVVVPKKIGDLKQSPLLPLWFDSAMIDFNKGRILCPKDLSKSQEISVVCSPKEYSLCFSDLSEGEIVDDIIDEAGESKNRKPNLFTAPRIFLCIDKIESEPFAFGGAITTSIFAKAIIFSKETYFLDNALSIFSDSMDEIFMEIDMSQYPLSEYGVLKEANSYNYENIVNENKNSGKNHYSIKKVISSKTNDAISRSLVHGMKIGFIEFEIEINRYRDNG